MADARRRILVVDDAEDNVDLLRRRLERRGYCVLTAMSGAEALDVIDAAPVDLVLLDVMMPGMSGVEVLQVIRRTRPRDTLPVIMATAKSDSANVVEALEMGANDYVTKPIELEVLLARMRVHLGAPPKFAPPPDEQCVQVVIGNVLDRKYRLEAVIGSGGFGTVYRATHLSLARDVAVKVLHGHLLESEGAVRRFRREGVSACRVQHPNAVAVLDAGITARGVPYLVMELLDGTSLSAELKEKGALPLSRAAEIIAPVCDALAEAHRRGIVHRDVTPANVLIGLDRDGAEAVKVLDFGIAKLVEHEPASDTTLGEITGTPDYMAPERLLGDPSDASADVYSVGVMLYRMLAGKLPFPRATGSFVRQAIAQLNATATPLPELRPDLPDDIARVVMSAISAKPDERASLDTIRETFERASQDWQEPEWPPPSLGALVTPRDPSHATDDAPTRNMQSGFAVSTSQIVAEGAEPIDETGPRPCGDTVIDGDEPGVRSGNDGS